MFVFVKKVYFLFVKKSDTITYAICSHNPTIDDSKD